MSDTTTQERAAAPDTEPHAHDGAKTVVSKARELLTLQLRYLGFERDNLLCELLKSKLQQLETIQNGADAIDRNVGTNGLISRLLVEGRKRVDDGLRERGLLASGDLDLAAYLVNLEKAFECCDSSNLLSRPSVPFETLGDRQAVRNVGHYSSPSVDGAGAHSVGDGPGAGDASATPATEVTNPHISARYDAPLNAIALSVGGTDDLYFDRDATFLLIDELRAALHDQAKNGGLA